MRTKPIRILCTLGIFEVAVIVTLGTGESVCDHMFTTYLLVAAGD